MALYKASDWKREISVRKGGSNEPYRSAPRRDFARLIHSPSFRRLQGKTQVFPGRESDYFRNRLTHSLEVAQIAKSIAIRLNKQSRAFRGQNRIDPDLVEFAGLGHDLGHPPFGHNGEEALDECMAEFGGFEGNAQTFRILSRLEKKETKDIEVGAYQPITADGSDLRVGLNLTYRSLASIFKYDRPIPVRYADRQKRKVMKGYYWDDAPLVGRMKLHVLGAPALKKLDGPFKTIECSIMDIADDIAYSTYDLEDNFKGGFLSPLELLSLENDVLDAVASDITERAREYYFDIVPINYEFNPLATLDVLSNLFSDMFKEDANGDVLNDEVMSIPEKKFLVSFFAQEYSNKLSRNGYYRTSFTSGLVQRFIQGVEIKPHGQGIRQLYTARLKFDTFLEVEVLKNITFHGVISSAKMQVVEHRGKDIVKRIFDAIDASNGLRLLPEDFQAVCTNASQNQKKRTICDFIAGMTDRYAIEFYTRLFGAEGLTIHKPL